MSVGLAFNGVELDIAQEIVPGRGEAGIRHRQLREGDDGIDTGLHGELSGQNFALDVGNHRAGIEALGHHFHDGEHDLGGRGRIAGGGDAARGVQRRQQPLILGAVACRCGALLHDRQGLGLGQSALVGAGCLQHADEGGGVDRSHSRRRKPLDQRRVHLGDRSIAKLELRNQGGC